MPSYIVDILMLWKVLSGLNIWGNVILNLIMFFISFSVPIKWIHGGIDEWMCHENMFLGFRVELVSNRSTSILSALFFYKKQKTCIVNYNRAPDSDGIDNTHDKVVVRAAYAPIRRLTRSSAIKSFFFYFKAAFIQSNFEVTRN